jgi:hypothetical protein
MSAKLPLKFRKYPYRTTRVAAQHGQPEHSVALI